MVGLIIGIDTNASSYHWVAYGVKGTTHGWWETDEANETIRRYDLIRSIITSPVWRDVAKDQATELHIFIEEPLSLQNGKTSRILAMSAAAVEAGFMLVLGGYIHWVDNQTWKKEILGRATPPEDFAFEPIRKRTKAWIAQSVFDMPEWQKDFRKYHSNFSEQLDLYDAWAICEYGKRMLN